MALTIFIAGLVRGFTGFGTGMIFMPIGALFLPVVDLILLLAVTGICSSAALLPRAWREADKPEVGALIVAGLMTIPFGLWLLRYLDDTTTRWILTGVIGLTLVAVITGWRWQGRLGWPGRLAVGGAAGTVGGLTRLSGPVVIVFYLANARSAAAVRANVILFLAGLDVAVTVNLVISGQADRSMVWIALILAVPYLITATIGQALFRPEYERLYRILAYTIVALALITGLPLFD